MTTAEQDIFYMKIALQEAHKAAEKGEVPVGAVIVYDNKIIGRGHNQTINLNDATAHAEMLAITAAYDFIGSRYLQECTLYVTLEPCVMCAGACYWSMFGKVVYGAGDGKYGFSRISTKILHQKTKILSGVLEAECKEILQIFFKKLRE
jgi:tRNA(adenine34) deaminase